MCTSRQPGHDLFRIFLYRKGATELLLESALDGFRLPVLAIPKYTRPAEELTREAENCWRLKTYCLTTLPAEDPSDPIRNRALLEACEPSNQCPSGMEWRCVAAQATNFATPHAMDSTNATTTKATNFAIAQATPFAAATAAAPFGRPGWLERVTNWVAEQAAPLGVRLTGEFRQLNASPTFSLIRFATNGPAQWFKAVGEPNLHEFPVTLKLAGLLPEFLPRIVASRPEWNAWLSVEASGVHLDGDSPFSHWQSAARSLRALQIASHGYALHLIAAGCRDLRVDALADLVDPFFRAAAEWMREQTKVTPAPLSEYELASLAGKIRCALSALRQSPIPDVLGHLDSNSRNILTNDEGCIFLDWAEACVGHPFFTFQYLLEHRKRIAKPSAQEDEILKEAYTREWRRFASERTIAADLRRTPLLAAFAYAACGVARCKPSTSVSSEIAGYLRALVRRMKREADSLGERRFACVP
jgi:hypothetical protein